MTRHERVPPRRNLSQRHASKRIPDVGRSQHLTVGPQRLTVGPRHISVGPRRLSVGFRTYTVRGPTVNRRNPTANIRGPTLVRRNPTVNIRKNDNTEIRQLTCKILQDPTLQDPTLQDPTTTVTVQHHPTANKRTYENPTVNPQNPTTTVTMQHHPTVNIRKSDSQPAKSDCNRYGTTPNVGTYYRHFHRMPFPLRLLPPHAAYSHQRHFHRTRRPPPTNQRPPTTNHQRKKHLGRSRRNRTAPQVR